jgi:hypothetical protein
VASSTGVDGDAAVLRGAIAGGDGVARATQFRIEGPLETFSQISKRFRGLSQMCVFFFELAYPG